MSKSSKKQYTNSEKLKIALEAIKGEMTVAQISSKYEVHSTQITNWKKLAIEAMSACFSKKPSPQANDDQKLIEDLYKQIGKLSTECEWLKKNLSYLNIETKRQIIKDDIDTKISLRRKCELLDLYKANLYYEPVKISEYKLSLLNKIDEIYTDHPYYGTRRMVQELKDYGYDVGRDLIRSCYATLGLETIYPKINLSKRNFEHKIYPYLLRNVAIENVNQVWSADITYIRMAHGFVYLVAIIDWYSRYILSWRLSNTLHYDFCVEALQDALQTYGNPKIFNTDQGCQFTANAWINELLQKDINISMDGRGRALDNVFIERFWRSLKQEKIYLMDLQSVQQTQVAITDYMKFYNTKRKHQSLDYLVPELVYQQGFII